jgi:hypothetical protein
VALRAEEGRDRVPAHHGGHDRGEDLPPPDLQDGALQQDPAGPAPAPPLLAQRSQGLLHPQGARVRERSASEARAKRERSERKEGAIGEAPFCGGG